MILKTDRLTITPSKISEAPFYFELFNDPDWKRFINDKNHKTTKDTEKYLKETLPITNQNGLGIFTVSITKTNEKIGAATLLKRDFLDHIDIGYAYLPKGRGKGYATEATKKMMDYCKTQLKTTTLNAIIKPNNKSSIKLIESLGFLFEKSDVFFEGNEKDNLYKN